MAQRAAAPDSGGRISLVLPCRAGRTGTSGPPSPLFGRFAASTAPEPANHTLKRAVASNRSGLPTGAAILRPVAIVAGLRANRGSDVYPRRSFRGLPPASGGGRSATGGAPVERWLAVILPKGPRSRAGACGQWECVPATRDSPDHRSRDLRAIARHSDRSRGLCRAELEATSAVVTQSARVGARGPRDSLSVPSARLWLPSAPGRTVPAPHDRTRFPTQR